MTVALLTTIVALVGCAQDSPSSLSPSQVSDEPMIIDEAAVLSRADFAFNVEQPAGFEGIALDNGAVVESPEQGWDVRVGWSALPCQTAPTVTLARAGERVEAKIDRGPEVIPPDSACESMEAHHYVDLALEGVTLDALSVEVSGD